MHQQLSFHVFFVSPDGLPWSRMSARAASIYSSEGEFDSRNTHHAFSGMPNCLGEQCHVVGIEPAGSALGARDLLKTLTGRRGPQITRSADKAPAVQIPAISFPACASCMQGWGQVLMHLLSLKDANLTGLIFGSTWIQQFSCSFGPLQSAMQNDNSLVVGFKMKGAWKMVHMGT